MVRRTQVFYCLIDYRKAKNDPCGNGLGYELMFSLIWIQIDSPRNFQWEEPPTKNTQQDSYSDLMEKSKAFQASKS